MIPDWLEPHILEEKETSIEGQNRKYLVVSRNLEPSLPLFAGYNNGLPFVSEDVPSVFRLAWVAHEVIEFEQFRDPDGKWLPEHCRRALFKELTYVPEDCLEEYFPLRLGFFNDLVDYLTKNKEPAELIEEVRKSRDGLEKFVNLLK